MSSFIKGIALPDDPSKSKGYRATNSGAWKNTEKSVGRLFASDRRRFNGSPNHHPSPARCTSPAYRVDCTNPSGCTNPAYRVDCTSGDCTNLVRCTNPVRRTSPRVHPNPSHHLRNLPNSRCHRHGWPNPKPWHPARAPTNHPKQRHRPRLSTTCPSSPENSGDHAVPVPRPQHRSTIRAVDRS